MIYYKSWKVQAVADHLLISSAQMQGDRNTPFARNLALKEAFIQGFYKVMERLLIHDTRDP